ncbi:hypothetical protein LINPERHAP1_LOCUS13474 [Linum perenne]
MISTILISLTCSNRPRTNSGSGREVFLRSPVFLRSLGEFCEVARLEGQVLNGRS